MDRFRFISKLNNELKHFNAKAIFSNNETHTLTIFHRDSETSIIAHPAFWDDDLINRILKEVIVKEGKEGFK